MVAAKKVAPSGSITNKLALEKVVAKKLIKKIAASKPTVKKAVAKKTPNKESVWKQPTAIQIACVHDFKPKPGFPIDKWVCTKGCGGVQTQLAHCNGNCRCGGEQ